jgi:hypothetical protein
MAFLEGPRKITKTLTIAGVPAEIRTEHESRALLLHQTDRYPLSNLVYF